MGSFNSIADSITMHHTKYEIDTPAHTHTCAISGNEILTDITDSESSCFYAAFQVKL